MRIFKYWVAVQKDLPIDNFIQPSKIYGGSNISLEDALEDAKRKMNNVINKAKGTIRRDEDYVADIREEIIERIDDENIVTRNRYGALVLNSSNTMFIDIDDYKPTFWQRLFGRKGNSNKDKILKNIQNTINSSKYTNFGFRVYETKNGFRVMVLSIRVLPKSNEARQMMKDFNSDVIYQVLCEKQNCYRARLTPKPSRIKHKSIKVKYPERSEKESESLKKWVESYNEASQKYVTCKLVFDHGHYGTNKVIEYHDRITKVKGTGELA